MWEGLNETDYGQDRISTINWIWGFEDEIKISKRIEQYNSPYNLNLVSIKNNSNNIKLFFVPFFKANNNIYITDLISKNSILMSETSIFNIQKNNF
jgi:hypothetical protein